MVVPVRRIAFEHGEFRVVRPVHALVAEVLGYLEDLLQTSDDESFQVELIGDAHVQRHVQRVVVGREGARRGSAIKGLKHGGLHFQELLLREKGPDVGDDLTAPLEAFPTVQIHGQVEMTPPAPVLHTHVVVLLRQCPDGLGQEGEVLDPDAQFVRAGAEEGSFHPDPVPDVDEFLDQAELLLTQVILAEISLDHAPLVLDRHEERLAGPTFGHDPPRKGDLLLRSGQRLLLCPHFGARVGAFVGIWIEFDLFAQLGHLRQAGLDQVVDTFLGRGAGGVRRPVILIRQFLLLAAADGGLRPVRFSGSGIPPNAGRRR